MASTNPTQLPMATLPMYSLLKSNYPGAWMAALMTCDRDDVTKVAKLIGESQAMNIPILPPDVNESGQEVVATPKGIRFAMGGIKGVGEGVVEAIIQERTSKGPFRSLMTSALGLIPKKLARRQLRTSLKQDVLISLESVVRRWSCL